MECVVFSLAKAVSPPDEAALRPRPLPTKDRHRGGELHFPASIRLPARTFRQVFFICLSPLSFSSFDVPAPPGTTTHEATALQLRGGAPARSYLRHSPTVALLNHLGDFPKHRLTRPEARRLPKLVTTFVHALASLEEVNPRARLMYASGFRRSIVAALQSEHVFGGQELEAPPYPSSRGFRRFGTAFA